MKNILLWLYVFVVIFGVLLVATWGVLAATSAFTSGKKTVAKASSALKEEGPTEEASTVHLGP